MIATWRFVVSVIVLHKLRCVLRQRFNHAACQSIGTVEGPSTYPQRKALFEEQRSHMEAELEQMNRTLDMLKFKCWYYEQAIKDGSEDRLKTLIPDYLPDGIRKAYENAHS